MPSLLDLPEHILEDIIELVFSQKEWRDALQNKIPVVINKDSDGKNVLHIYEPSVLSVSRYLKVLAQQVLLLRAAFHVQNEDSMKEFMERIGERDSQRIKNVSVPMDFHQFFAGLKPNHSVSDYNNCLDIAEKTLERTAAFIQHLPADLCGFNLHSSMETGEATTPPFLRSLRYPPKLIEAVQRFSNLRELELVFSRKCPLFLGILWTEPFATPHELAPKPIFPYLRRLYLQGTANYAVTEVELAEALSEEQLPSLQFLQIIELTFDSNSRAGRSRFTPEVLLAIRPLSVLHWLCTSDLSSHCGLSYILPSPPTMSHFYALAKRHGETLRELLILHHQRGFLTTNPDPPNFADETEKLLDGMPKLESVEIRIPEVQIHINQ